ncbi:MAG: toast rack family protein [Anaerolineales bacterium]
MGREHERGSLVWPLLLILVGSVILLNNIGTTSIDLWGALLRLWPVILMAVGIELLIPRRSIWGTLVALALILAVFAIAYFGMTGIQAAAPAGERIEQSIGGATAADVILEPAVGSIEVGGGAASGLLIEGTVVPLSGERIDTQVGVEENRASVTIASTGSRGGFLVFPSSRGRWDLSLSEVIPLTVRANLGVGTMTLDLSRVRVEEIVAEVGVGRLEVYLPAGPGTQVRLNGGVGATVIWLPAGARAQIEAAHDLAGLSLPSGAEERDGFIYTGGADADSADLHLAIEQAIGSISIRQQ